MLKLRNYGWNGSPRNVIAIEIDEIKFYFSYETIVAVQIGQELYVSENVCNAATGKHLNWIDGGDKGSRLSRRDFEAVVDSITVSANKTFASAGE